MIIDLNSWECGDKFLFNSHGQQHDNMNKDFEWIKHMMLHEKIQQILRSTSQKTRHIFLSQQKEHKEQMILLEKFIAGLSNNSAW